MISFSLGQYEVVYSDNAAEITLYSQEYFEKEHSVFFRDAIEKHKLVAHPAVQIVDLSVDLDCSHEIKQ